MFYDSTIQVLLDKWEDGRLNTITVKKGDLEQAEIFYLYDADKNIRQLNIMRGDVPLSTVLEVLNARFIDRIGRIEDIELIKEVRLLQDKGAIEGTDVNLVAEDSVGNGVLTLILSYTVPAGHTLLIYDWSVALINGKGEVNAYLYNNTTSTIIGVGGASRGFQTPFSKPKAVLTGQVARIYVNQHEGADRDVQVHIGGIFI
jgi:hypothetical protein